MVAGKERDRVGLAGRGSGDGGGRGLVDVAVEVDGFGADEDGLRVDVHIVLDGGRTVGIDDQAVDVHVQRGCAIATEGDVTIAGPGRCGDRDCAGGRVHLVAITAVDDDVTGTCGRDVDRFIVVAGGVGGDQSAQPGHTEGRLAGVGFSREDVDLAGGVAALSGGQHGGLGDALGLQCDGRVGRVADIDHTIRRGHGLVESQQHLVGVDSNVTGIGGDGSLQVDAAGCRFRKHNSIAGVTGVSRPACRCDRPHTEGSLCRDVRVVNRVCLRGALADIRNGDRAAADSTVSGCDNQGRLVPRSRGGIVHVREGDVARAACRLDRHLTSRSIQIDLGHTRHNADVTVLGLDRDASRHIHITADLFDRDAGRGGDIAIKVHYGCTLIGDVVVRVGIDQDSALVGSDRICEVHDIIGATVSGQGLSEQRPIDLERVGDGCVQVDINVEQGGGTEGDVVQRDAAIRSDLHFRDVPGVRQISQIDVPRRRMEIVQASIGIVAEIDGCHAGHYVEVAVLRQDIDVGSEVDRGHVLNREACLRRGVVVGVEIEGCTAVHSDRADGGLDVVTDVEDLVRSVTIDIEGTDGDGLIGGQR